MTEPQTTDDLQTHIDAMRQAAEEHLSEIGSREATQTSDAEYCYDRGYHEGFLAAVDLIVGLIAYTKMTDRWGRLILTEEEETLLDEVAEAFWGAYDAAPNGEGVMGAAEFGAIAAVLAACRGLKAPEAVAKAIGEIGTYGVPRKYKLVPREPGDPL